MCGSVSKKDFASGVAKDGHPTPSNKKNPVALVRDSRDVVPFVPLSGAHSSGTRSAVPEPSGSLQPVQMKTEVFSLCFPFFFEPKVSFELFKLSPAPQVCLLPRPSHSYIHVAQPHTASENTGGLISACGSGPVTSQVSPSLPVFSPISISPTRP